MAERNGIIDTTQKCSYAKDHVIVADGIGYGRLYTPIANMTRSRDKKALFRVDYHPKSVDNNKNRPYYFAQMLYTLFLRMLCT